MWGLRDEEGAGLLEFRSEDQMKVILGSIQLLICEKAEKDLGVMSWVQRGEADEYVMLTGPGLGRQDMALGVCT